MRFAVLIVACCIVYYFFFGPAPEKEVTNFPAETVQKVNEVPQGTNWIAWAFCLCAAFFVITVYNSRTNDAKNIGIKKTRKGAFQLILDIISDSGTGEKVTSAGVFTDEGGTYDEIETRDAFDVEKTYYITKTEDLNKLDPDDYK